MSQLVLSWFQLGRGVRLCLGASLLLAASAQSAFAVFVDPSLSIPTQLLSFGPIQGDAFLPLTSAATTSTMAGVPATVDGYGWVDSRISITLSSQQLPTPGPASTGAARLGVPGFPPADAVNALAGTIQPSCIEGGQAGNVNNGGTVCVNSFFDVFFDVTISNIDSTASFFAGAGPQTLTQQDIGPMLLQQQGECTADTSKPNLGCLPPVGSAYIGHFQVAVPLGVDINGNGSNDTIKFDFLQHTVGTVVNSSIQGVNVIDTFNSTIPGGGSVGDGPGDPPFTFNLTGTTTAQQGIVYPAASAVPEPASILLLGSGIALLGLSRRRKAA